MLFNVPQFINVEDKIVGPFTGRQLLWMFGLGAVLLVLWNILEKTYFLFVGTVVSLVFAAFAFYRPYNQPLIKFITSAVLFLIRPRIYFWERDVETKTSARPVSDKSSVDNANKKNITPEELKTLAKMLDSKERYKT